MVKTWVITTTFQDVLKDDEGKEERDGKSGKNWWICVTIRYN